MIERRGKQWGPDPKTIYATSTQGIASSSHPMATDTALEMLRRGGNAADAYVAAAAMQTVVEPTMTTLAGILGLSFFDATAQHLRSIGCWWAAPEAEDGRMSAADTWSGRAVMIPSWVNAANAVSERLGKLPWKDLFAPAIEAASEGIPIDEFLWGWTYEFRAMAARDAEARSIWQPHGYLLGVGDTLRQPALARTLEQLAEEGPEYFYRGPFAKRFVEKVQASGGRLSLADMKRHETAISDFEAESLGSYRGLDVYGTGGFYPAEGGASVIALNLVEEGNLRAGGRPSESAETLYHLMRIVEEAWTAGLAYQAESHDVLLSKEYAKQLWRLVQHAPPRSYPALEAGTNGLVVVDSEGNVAVGCHSSSSTPYGSGIVVDGVYANRVLFLWRPLPACFSSSHVLMKDGRPIFAMASPSGSVFPNLVQCTVNVFEFEMDLGDCVNEPRFGGPFLNTGLAMVETSYPEEVLTGLSRRGMPFFPISPWEPHLGSCHAVYIDPGSGTLHGVADPRRLGVTAGL